MTQDTYYQCDETTGEFLGVIADPEPVDLLPDGRLALASLAQYGEVRHG